CWLSAAISRNALASGFECSRSALSDEIADAGVGPGCFATRVPQAQEVVFTMGMPELPPLAATDALKENLAEPPGGQLDAVYGVAHRLGRPARRCHGRASVDRIRAVAVVDRGGSGGRRAGALPPVQSH